MFLVAEIVETVVNRNEFSERPRNSVGNFGITLD